MINWNVTSEDRSLISSIVDRAMPSFGAFDRMSLEMDITAVHANGNPPCLTELLLADDFNFSHDVFGIVRHLDRRTGTLGDCFVPRFSRREVES
jgi:hypothetical protein